jgi:predicted ATP-grasp superfamily ATP-dependent carboligase
MDIEVYLSESQKYVVCRALAPITEEMTVRMTNEVAKIAEQSGVKNRLIDVRGMRNTMPVSVNYDLAYTNMDAMQIERSTKVASLQSAGDTSHEFVCNAIRNSGFNLRIFTDEADAIAWLKE